jgi:hypothetical protein
MRAEKQDARDMTAHEITCTIQYPPNQPHDHAAITHVGLSNGIERYTTNQILQWLAQGHQFYVRDPKTGATAYVEPCSCKGAHNQHIRTKPDSSRRDNLDALPRCT